VVGRKRHVVPSSGSFDRNFEKGRKGEREKGRKGEREKGRKGEREKGKKVMQVG